MTFLAPMFLAGIAAAAVPIVLHLLKRHADRRVRFSAVHLLRAAPSEHSSQRRLRRLLLLALRVSALVLLSLAFARPIFRAASANSARLTVVALDTSLSMSAPARVREAQRLAADAIQSAAPGDVAVVTFSDRASVEVEPTPSRRAAIAAVKGAVPGYGATSYRAALATAAGLFRGRAGTLVVITDLQANGWSGDGTGAVPDGVEVEVRDVGPLTENLAVTQLHTDGDRLVATVINAGSREKVAKVALTIDGKPAASTAVEIRARDVADVTFNPIRSSGIARVTVDDPDGIAGDNSRFVFVGRPMGSVLVVTTSGDLDKDAWYVRHALDITSAVSSGRAVAGVSAAQLDASSDAKLAPFAAVVVLSSRGLERRARERLAAYVAAGGGLLLAAGPDVDGEVVADVLGTNGRLELKAADAQSVSMGPTDLRHPVFHVFSGDTGPLTLARFRSIARVTAPNCRTIARFTSGDAAVLECAHGRGRALIVASDLNNQWNDFAAHASFVPFVDQAIRYLASGRRVGDEVLVANVPPGVAPMPGVVTLKDDRGSRPVIVNIDPRETALDRMSDAEFHQSIDRFTDRTAGAVRADLAEQEGRQHLWQYVMAAMVVALFVEGAVAAGVS